MSTNPIREIAERAAQRYSGQARPPVTVRDRGRQVGAPVGVDLMNDPTTGDRYAVYDVDDYDDADAVYAP